MDFSLGLIGADLSLVLGHFNDQEQAWDYFLIKESFWVRMALHKYPGSGLESYLGAIITKYFLVCSCP